MADGAADVLLYLDADLETIRRRRPISYGQEVLDEQRRRLADARQHCDGYLSTDDLTPQEVEAWALEVVRRRQSQGT